MFHFGIGLFGTKLCIIVREQIPSDMPRVRKKSSLPCVQLTDPPMPFKLLPKLCNFSLPCLYWSFPISALHSVHIVILSGPTLWLVEPCLQSKTDTRQSAHFQLDWARLWEDDSRGIFIYFLPALYIPKPVVCLGSSSCRNIQLCPCFSWGEFEEVGREVTRIAVGEQQAQEQFQLICLASEWQQVQRRCALR